MAALPRCFLVALLLLAGVLLQASAAPPGEGEPLAAGESRGRAIDGQERQVYRIAVTAVSPLLVTVEQQGIDLAVEDGIPGEPAAVTVNAPNGRWGPETLVLTAAGEHRIEVRSAEPAYPAGRYTITVAALPDDARRRAAEETMFLAGQRSFTGTPASLREATDLARQAAAAWQALGDRRREAEARDSVANFEQEIGELRPSLTDHRQAIALWRELGDARREASALNWLGIVQYDLGDLAGARESLNGALTLRQGLDDRFGAAETRLNLCLVEQKAGNLRAALACYEEDRALFHEIGDRSQEALIQNNLGGVYDLLGKPDAALASYEQALELRKASGDYLGEAQTLNNIAVVRRTLGEWQEALRIYAQAREILAPLRQPLREAAVLHNLGFAYLDLGEPRRALVFLQDSLEICHAVGDHRGEIVSHNSLGLAHRSLGELAEAVDQYHQALELATAAGDHWQMAVARMRLAEILLERGDAASALSETDRALALLAELGISRVEVTARELRGRVLTLAGRSAEALPILREALSLRRTFHDRAAEAATLHALAQTERRLGLTADARAHAEAAVARVEELRAGFLTPSLRTAFLATQHQAYSLLIDLLLESHTANPPGNDDRRALQVSEEAHARSLLDTLYQGPPGHAAAVPRDLLERRLALQYRLSALADQQARPGRLNGKEAAAALEESDKVLAELDGIEAEVRRGDPDRAAAQPPPDAAGIAALLDPGTVFLEYALGEDGSHVWAVSAGTFRSAALPPQREIEELARRAYAEMSTVEAGSGVRDQATAALSRTLLAPVWSEVAQARRLVVVPDGALHFVPFGALLVPAAGDAWNGDAAGRERLLEAREVVHLPSAASLAVERQRLAGRPPAPRWVAILADPVFSPADPRLSKKDRSSQGTSSLDAPFERLDASGREAEDIAALAPAGQAWKAVDFAADREAVLTGDLRSYRVLHFATHGLVNADRPELSGLVLSRVDPAGRPREGFLSLQDIYGLDLAADLVVLSGCQMALGPVVRGEGLTSLTRGFLHAGVPRVVATLWKTEDHASAELMKRFYEALWQNGLPPAAALRKAQLDLRHDPRRRAPYFWAGFLLQGDWRGTGEIDGGAATVPQ